MVRIPGLDVEVLPLNLGCNTFGWTTDQTASYAVLDAFVAAGGTFVDTADGYPQWAPGCSGGESEQILGSWLAARDNRDAVVVATKVGSWAQRKGLAAATILAACDDSLRRLGTDRIDLYYAHRDDEVTPIPEMAGAFDALVREGKVRAVGISNLAPERMREWLTLCDSDGLAKPVALQNEYSLVRRHTFETDFAPIAGEHHLATFPYYSLASGFLSGKYRTASDLEGKARRTGAGQYLTGDGIAVLDALVTIADSRGVAPATVALAWMLARGVTAPIASATTPSQVGDLVAATTLALDPADVAALDTASAPFA